MNPRSFGSRFKPHFFPLRKALHGIFSKYTEIQQEKYKIH